MIIIAKTITGNRVEPSRQLTTDELRTIIAQWGDENNYWYFTNDDKNNNTSQWQAYQSYTNQVSVALNWRGLTTDLYNSALFAKALQSAASNAYATLLKIMSDGENGLSNENTFLAIFNMLNVSWTTDDKAQINSILQNNSFTIRIS